MQENWRDVEGYEGLYQISSKRRVKSLNYNRTGKEEIIKQCKDKDGYLQVHLYKEGEYKTCKIHRLVGQAFIPNSEGLPQINHKDEDKTNNCVENLEWCTREYNNNYGTRNERASKSLSKQVMCVETGKVFRSTKEAQKKTGVFSTSIAACARHDKYYYTARRFHWEYV